MKNKSPSSWSLTTASSTAASLTAAESCYRLKRREELKI